MHFLVIWLKYYTSFTYFLKRTKFSNASSQRSVIIQQSSVVNIKKTRSSDAVYQLPHFVLHFVFSHRVLQFYIFKIIFIISRD